MEIIREAGRVPIKCWTDGVELEDSARQQLLNVASLPFIHRHVAVMPDVHWGMGATVGSVIPTVGAIVPAAVGVDIGCGMMAQRTTLGAKDLPDSLGRLRFAIERAVPVGGPGERGSWKERGRHGIPHPVLAAWATIERDWNRITERHPKVSRGLTVEQLATLGTGNHFIEICLDESDAVWVMLHSGSRGIGNRIGTYFIERAKEEMRRGHVALPDANLAYLSEGSALFEDYVHAVRFAQNFAAINRRLMMDRVIHVLREHLPPFQLDVVAVNCHHNYIARERHHHREVWVTRKGAVRAGEGELGIIPGCFTADTRILMADGLYKDIAAINVGERVISGSGAPTTVLARLARGTRATWSYRNNCFHAPTRATPDHRHFIGDLSTADYQQEGRVKILERPTIDGKTKYMWRSLDELSNNSTLLLPRAIDFSDMPSSFEIEMSTGWLLRPSCALGYIFGTFLGDGTSYYTSRDGGQATWAFGLNEDSIAAVLKDSLDEIFAVNAKVYRNAKNILVVVHSANVARLLLDFGKREHKALPRQFWCNSRPYLQGLYDGLIASDGHVNNQTAKFTNTSPVLIEQFGVIHYHLFGYFPSISRRSPSAGGLRDCDLARCKPSYRATSLRLPPLARNHQLVEILSLDRAEERYPVYDIEVESETHSFIANNAIVHNSMGAKSFIVRGKGEPESFESCSHGAGRKMSRSEAKRRITLADHLTATAGIECRKDEGVIDESPAAYKDVDAVMRAQSDLVEIVHTLRQVVVVKG